MNALYLRLVLQIKGIVYLKTLRGSAIGLA